jgi:DNA-3-methyladenine glycosylase
MSGNFTIKDIKYENKLDRKYFRQDVVELSKSLLGKLFVRKTENGIIKAVIVETEAYKAPLDKACHAYNSTNMF